MELRSIEKAEVSGKRIIVRCGFDVPFDESGNIVDDIRIRECVPTISYLIEKKAKIILCSHNGRPKGKRVEKLSMDKIAVRLQELLPCPVKKLDDCIGEEVEQAVGTMKKGDVLVLENLRFHAEEKENDPSFAKHLASLADIYVNEAFANSHRDHASMTGVPRHLPAYAGFRLIKEINILSGVMENPDRPLVAIIGGAKISDKLGVINQFMKLADHVLIGGALANTILRAKGVSVGKSIVDEAMVAPAKKLALTDPRFHVPVDVIVANEMKANVPTKTLAVGNVSDNEYILDIGPDTLRLFTMIIEKAKTVIWGGPMGYFELSPFASGTMGIAKAVAKSGAKSIIGGGDTLEAIDRSGFADKMSFISTGGGAMLEFIENKTLPALQPLLIK